MWFEFLLLKLLLIFLANILKQLVIVSLLGFSFVLSSSVLG